MPQVFTIRFYVLIIGNQSYHGHLFLGGESFTWLPQGNFYSAFSPLINLNSLIFYILFIFLFAYLANFPLVYFYLCNPFPNTKSLYISYISYSIHFLFFLPGKLSISVILFFPLTHHQPPLYFLYCIFYLFSFFYVEKFPFGLFYLCLLPSRSKYSSFFTSFYFKVLLYSYKQKRPGPRYLPFDFVY